MRSRSLEEIFSDPRHGRLATGLVLGLLAWIALVLRQALDLGGVLDTDVMNFGLAAFDFDVLAHQPHPPGYPGYVLFLQLVHALAPGLGPIEVAKTGTLVCGVLVVLAAFWACRQVLVSEEAPRPVGRPLAAAGFAVFHPLLWFYGGDGQSHAAEALLVLLLFGACARVRRGPGRVRLLVLVAAFGLSGAVRPTIPLLSSPMLLWVFWGRPWRDWALALVTGVVSVVAWYLPLVLVSGGWDLYHRASRALVGELFVANYSVFGKHAALSSVLMNVQVTALSTALALLPLVAMSRPRGQPWLRTAAAVTAASAGFYALVFLAEPGYVIGIAALACLVPATWPAALPKVTGLRAGLVPVLALAYITLGPENLPTYGTAGVLAPTYARVAGVDQVQRVYHEAVCGAARGQPALVLTDNPTTLHLRWLTLVCPGMSGALYLGSMPLNPMDGWLIYTPDSMRAVPGPVPLEPGAPASVTLDPVARVLVAPDSTRELQRAVAAPASCAPRRHVPESVGEMLAVPVWPARCMPAVRIGENVLSVPSIPDPDTDTGPGPGAASDAGTAPPAP